MKNALGTALGMTLPATLLFDYPTIEALAGYLADNVPALRGTAKRPDASPHEGGAGAAILDDIEQLSEEEALNLLAQKLSGPSE